MVACQARSPAKGGSGWQAVKLIEQASPSPSRCPRIVLNAAVGWRHRGGGAVWLPLARWTAAVRLRRAIGHSSTAVCTRPGAVALWGWIRDEILLAVVIVGWAARTAGAGARDTG